MTNKERKAQLTKMRRKARSRVGIFGTSVKPRLHVSRSLQYFSAQIIDDTEGKTLISAHTREVKIKGKIAQAEALGKLVAEKAKAKKITRVVFDRSGYKYHGRVKAFADGARAGGLVF
ncbi:MAG: 50S ribosomal protein L18 [Candidatus Kerfeldbacteria bacterium RIFCSPHIGHO2_12_FULL_48_17]|uniref:Large ribosomal subunit protein uL18 n=1 Tax=Candidatus Kerfeldbacteria bacterium RIFCSPHIGHO2_12_FULL_48_17 TaxID=1798542 RepID=A0A1G2B4Z8_9BACT|nr:MAG: 50S ribosomal protein L18 [Candidatus Kerfeldbacteria bacterium RIFCSPHIGHO2_12_FULL_48_17]